jgi:hypothetical protein
LIGTGFNVRFLVSSPELEEITPAFGSPVIEKIEEWMKVAGRRALHGIRARLAMRALGRDRAHI